jgi:hypothetical protein
MSTKRKQNKPASKFDRDIEKMIADYIAATGDNDWNRLKVAAWAIANGKWEQHKASAVRELARVISRVAGKSTFVDEDGNTVRKYHAWRLGHDQPTLWSSIDTITVENMKFSINSRRDKLVNGAVKAIIDAEHFNKHYNPGDPIHIETDLTKDVNEKRQPGLYDDTTPDDPG